MTCGARQGSTLVSLLFLIYINDIANSSDKLSFRLFADDANIFYASDDINDIESVINCEMTRALNYYSINKLSVNMKKLTWNGSLLIVLKSGIKIISSNISHSSEFPNKIQFVIIIIKLSLLKLMAFPSLFLQVFCHISVLWKRWLVV